MHGISIHPLFDLEDLTTIFEHIAKDNLAAARLVNDGIIATFSLIAEEPHIGRPYPHEHPLLQGIRMCPAYKIPGRSFGNYLIFFRPYDREIRILYVFHAARDISNLMAEDLRR